MISHLTIVLASSLSATPVFAEESAVTTHSGTSIAEHGGGCRKDSPPGQCCHAGSQPYHCH